MPEIGEIARTVHYIRKHLLHRTITTCTAHPDDIVYGKVGTTSDAFSAALTGRRVTGADQQGKYFYMTFDKPPHAVMHFGMTGWMKFSCEDTAYYKQAKDDKEKKEEEWPPKYVKFLLRCETEEGREAVEAAFVDARRLARIRLVDCAAEDIRNASPLKENGPDPVRDRDVVTVQWLGELLGRKRVPVKALLLDQSNLSGVGNWVADEVLYQARIHPEQYSNTFGEKQVEQLHEALMRVCTTAVETLADSKQFPEDWLMKYRWDKGKKGGNVLPSGEKIVHLTVGGRTSAIVPSRQKKTGKVAGDVGEEGEGIGGKGRKRKVKDEDAGDAAAEDEPPAAKRSTRAGRGKTNGTKAVAEGAGDAKAEQDAPVTKRGTRRTRGKANGVKAEAEGADDANAEDEPPASKRAAKGKKGKSKAVKAKVGTKDIEEAQANGGAEAVDGGKEVEAKPSRRPSTRKKV